MKYAIRNSALTAIALLAVSAVHANEISQVPLIVTSNVPPNVVLTMDDSGTMQNETLPNEVSEIFGGDLTRRTVRYMFPRGNQGGDFADRNADPLYGGSDDYWTSEAHVTDNLHNVPTFSASNKWAAFFRSSHNNPLYYDPERRYEPWFNSDGTSFADADPAAAPHNPANPGLGTRDLTTDNNQWACWIEPDAETLDDTEFLCDGFDRRFDYYPATYFQFNGGDEMDPANYTRIEIRDDGSTYPGGSERTDCADPGNCTYAEEIQNFANWYSYHRARVLTARAGVGRAFAVQGENLRIGYAAVNANIQPGVDNWPGEPQRAMVRGVRMFAGADRDEFFDLLYGRDLPLAPTPSRRALDDVGQYYTRADDRGPWSETPGESGGEQLECRNSYAMLMTDGYWTEGDDAAARTVDARANVDGTAGDLIEHPDPDQSDFQYQPEPPFEDDWSDTLADVAMYYWKRDLRTDLDNRVPVTPGNEAFWQHMVTYGISLGVEGTLDPDNDLSALTAGNLDWPDPLASDAAKLDDLWHATVNSRGRLFDARQPAEFADGLSEILADLVARTEGSAASVAANSTRLDTGTRIYQARFNSSNWSGQLVAFDVNLDGTVGDSVWDAAENIPAHGQRKIFAWDDEIDDGIRFEWSGLTANQRNLIDADNAGNVSSPIMDWLRGDDSNELRHGGTLRNRALLSSGDTNVMGDIVNSDPFLVGRDDFNFSILPEPEGSEYLAFRSSALYQNRPEVLYVGANAGMLHAIDATHGHELFAYVPNEVMANLSELTDPDYTHRFYVNGKLRGIDAYIDVGSGAEWRTVLVGATGAGGQAVFALDVTDPANFSENDILWEFTHPDLGYTIGQPSVARLENGDWVAIFGNGYDSGAQTSQLFVVDLATGELKGNAPYDTGIGDVDDPNGMSSVVPVDPTGARITEFAYMGDLHGNLWRFDLTGNTNNWDFTHGGNPVFTAEAGDGRRQPITVRPEVSRHPRGGYAVHFGTGQLFREGDNLAGSDPVIQSFYGIQDDGTSTARSELQAQEIVVEFTGDSGFDFRVVDDQSVDANQRGWYIDLNYPETPAEGERVIEDALLRDDRIIFVTTIPSTDPCDFGGEGWLMEVNAYTGARLDYAVFDVDGDGAIGEGDAYELEDGTMAHAGGRRSQDVITAPTVLDTGGGTEFKYMSAASGEVTVVEEAASGRDLGRQSWRQLR